MMLLTFYFYNLVSIHHLTIYVVNFLYLQSVKMHGSEFPYRCAHSPVTFVFIDPNFCAGSGLCLYQNPFCVYTMVINEAPVFK